MFGELNNVKNTVREGIDTTEMEFKKLSEFCGQTIKVDGFFFTSGDYGKQVVLVGNGFLINMPGRAVEVFEKIFADDEMLDAVLNGHLAIKNIKTKQAKKGNTVIYDLADC